MKDRRNTPPRTACLCLLILLLAAPVWGQGFSPAQEQEYLDAQRAVELARSAQAEQYDAEGLKVAREWLLTAQKARASKDATQFAQASRLARTHAELAEAISELKKEQEALTATNEALQKVKAEIERLRKAR